VRGWVRGGEDISGVAFHPSALRPESARDFSAQIQGKAQMKNPRCTAITRWFPSYGHGTYFFPHTIEKTFTQIINDWRI
jgi:hypothetical protein